MMQSRKENISFFFRNFFSPKTTECWNVNDGIYCVINKL